MKQKNNLIRISVAVTIALNIAFNYFYHPLFGLPDIKTVSDKYASLVTPAPYAFSIWGLIYSGFIIYAVYQFFPSQRKSKIYVWLAPAVLISNLLGSLWIVSFTEEYIVTSVFIITLNLITAVIAFVISEKEKSQHPWIHRLWSIYAGWLTMATIADLSQSLVYLRMIPGDIFNMLLVLLAFVIAMAVMIRKNNYAYPLVVAWALIAIYVQQKYQPGELNLESLALGTAIVFSSVVFIYRRSQQRVIATEKIS